MKFLFYTKICDCRAVSRHQRTAVRFQSNSQLYWKDDKKVKRGWQWLIEKNKKTICYFSILMERWRQFLSFDVHRFFCSHEYLLFVIGSFSSRHSSHLNSVWPDWVICEKNCLQKYPKNVATFSLFEAETAINTFGTIGLLFNRTSGHTANTQDELGANSLKILFREKSN